MPNNETRKNEATWIESRQRWQIKVQRDGERRAFTSTILGKKGKAEAERQADKWLEVKYNKDIRFEKLWEMFLEDTKNHKKSGSSANYVQHEKMGRLWILPYIKKTKRLSTLTTDDYQAGIDAAAKAGKSRRTCVNIRASLTAVYGFARKKKYRMEPPEFLVIPENAPTKERRILQPDDLKILFSTDAIMHYNKERPCWYIHAWRFLVVTGLRRGELCGLERADREDNILYIRRSVNSLGETTQGKTKNAQRCFVLNRHAQRILSQQEDMLKAAGIISPYLFPDEHGDRTDPNRLYDKWATYRKQHGISSSLHEMRHTMISIAKVDAPEELLKAAVGHSKNMNTFSVYGHTVDGEMQRLADILDEAYDKVLE